VDIGARYLEPTNTETITNLNLTFRKFEYLFQKINLINNITAYQCALFEFLVFL